MSASSFYLIDGLLTLLGSPQASSEELRWQALLCWMERDAVATS